MESSYASYNSLNTHSVDKYLSPVSGKITTIVLPLFSGRLASSKPAKVAAAEEIPVKIPSSRANFNKVDPASSSFTGMTSSIRSNSNTSGTKPGPIP